MAARKAQANSLVWAVSSYRAGENSQIRGLVERLGVPWELKKLAYNAAAGPLGVLRQVSVLGVEGTRSSPLEGPWPDLIVSAGVKNEPVCRWIRRQSGGRTRLVFLGRVWASYELFDLIITTPQYRLPERNNILHRTTTLHGITRTGLAQAAEPWRTKFSTLPRPRIGVLLGGNSGPYVLGRAAAHRLVKILNEACATGGSALITTSARTSKVVSEVLGSKLDCPFYLHEQNVSSGDNPYFGILELADRFIVSGDSVAMLSEAAGTGKPVQIFPLPDDGSEDFSVKAKAYQALMRWGPNRLSRDVSLFHDQFLLDGGGRDLEDTLERVRALLIGSEAENSSNDSEVGCS